MTKRQKYAIIIFSLLKDKVTAKAVKSMREAVTMAKSEDCIFCKIISGDIPSNKVYEDEYVLAFKDINPQAPVHIVVIPKTHMKSANDVTPENSIYVQKIFEAVPEIAKSAGVAEDGYRIISNCGKNAGQTVDHLHFHILGGKIFSENF